MRQLVPFTTVELVAFVSEIGDGPKLVEPNSAIFVSINKFEDSLQVLLSHADSLVLVHFCKVIEGE